MKNKKLMAWMLAAALTASALAAPVYTAQAQETNGTEVVEAGNTLLVDAEDDALNEAAENTFTEVGQTIKVEGQKSGESREFTLVCEETGEYIIRYMDTGNVSNRVDVMVIANGNGTGTALRPVAKGRYRESNFPVSLEAGTTYTIRITPTNEEENVSYELYFGTEPEIVDIEMNYDFYVVEAGTIERATWWGIDGFPFVVTYSDGSVQNVWGPRDHDEKNEIDEERPYLPYDDYGNYFIFELKDESQQFYFDFVTGGDYPVTIAVNGNEQMVFEEVINISDPSGKYDVPVISVYIGYGMDRVRYECRAEKQEVTLKELFPDGIPVQEKEGYEIIGWSWNEQQITDTETDTIFIESDVEAFFLTPVYREISQGGNEGGTPSEPSAPSEPTTPDAPSEPSEPSVPSEPTVPSEPDEPTTPDSFVYDAEAFEELLKTQDVVVKPNDYVTITFAKGDAKEVSGKTEYDFSAAVVSDYEKANLPSYIRKDSFISAVDYAYAGELPAEASIQILVGTKYAGKQVYYFLLKEDNTYAEVQSVKVDENGYITVTQNHCSKYVITTQNPKASADTNPSTDKIPQTGDTNPILPYTMLLAAGVIVIVSKKRLVND